MFIKFLILLSLVEPSIFAKISFNSKVRIPERKGKKKIKINLKNLKLNNFTC